MSLFGNKNDFNFAVNNIGYKVTLLEDKIEIKRRIGNFEPNYIYYNQLKSYKMVSEKEVLEKNKSISGALIGGVLFGGVGAVVGAIDGASKHKTQNKYYYEFTYDENGEEKIARLEIIGATMGLSNMEKQIKNKVGF